MPHIHRFFIGPGELAAGDRFTLRDDEAHHALRVVRVQAGDSVALFDGRGQEWAATVDSVTRGEVNLRITDSRRIERPVTRLALYQAWLHRDKPIEEIIRRGTEIGIQRFVYFGGRRSERTPRLSEKWQRLAVEACKQCGRLWLPEFAVEETLESALATARGNLLVAAVGRPSAPVRGLMSCGDISLFVGPEGDFTDEELELLLAKGAHVITLGDATYRSETAAILASSIVLYECGRLGPLP
ncbi:MAG: ribosomal RNA small subunit methyltransferase E [Candidatus Hydrogenedentota bacterium]